MALDKFRDPADTLWEQRVNQLEEGTGVFPEVPSSKIKNEAVTPAKLNKELPGRRLIMQAPFVLKEKTKTTVTSFLSLGGEAVTVEGSSATAVEVIEKGLALFVYLKAGYETVGKTNKQVMEVCLATNAAAPTASFEFQLFKVATVAGAAKKLNYTTTAVAASKVEIASPAAESISREMTNFAVLENGASYLFGVKPSAETAASSLVTGVVQLFAVNE